LRWIADVVKINPAAFKIGVASVVMLWPLISFGKPSSTPTVTQPARIVRRYTLVSSLGTDDHDPSAWRLLGSNDRGETWTILDVRTNQSFAFRSQHLNFRVQNPGAYNTYRLQIDAKNAETILIDMSVDLAELILLGPLVNAPSEADLQPIITASCPHPVLGLPENAFDQDPSTKWVDFGLNSTNGCWLQIRYSLQSEAVITNLTQASRLTHLSTDQEWLDDKGPGLLAYLADATSPPRRLSGYALTTANDEPTRDPRDWKLLGSNDGGKTWAVLDVRVNQRFTERFQRRVFQLTNAAAYRLYRLEIDSAVQPESMCQIGEIEPLYADAEANGHYSVVVGANADNPPLESVEMAFDGDPKTKWLTFEQVSPGIPAWIQWQSVPRDETMPVINQRQLDRLARSLSAAKLLDQASIPLVAVDGYALTSANDHAARDPRDWKLEGSKDGGKTWQTLDVRRDEHFERRMQRREFHLTNSAACQWFRLQIDSVYNPTNANSVQLAGLELLYANPASAQHLTALVRSQGEHPPSEITENLFDNDPKSKWLDGTGPVSNRASWVEWRYASGGGTATIDLDRDEVSRTHAAKRSQLRLDAAVVFVDPKAGVVGLVDQTAFARFQLTPWPEHLAPGWRAHLTGDLQAKGGVLRVSDARLDSVQPLPLLEGAPASAAGATNEAFASTTITGKVEGVFSGPLYSGARVTTANGPPLLLRVVGAAFPRLPSLDCQVIVHGVLERLLNDKGELEPSVVWVASPQDITFAPKVEPHESPSNGATNEPPLLTRISEVREFMSTQTNQPARVKIRGVITYIDLNLGTFYMQDGEDGVAIYGQLNAGLYPSLSQEGDYVELDANIVSDGTLIATSFVRVLGKGRYPQPARPSWDHLMTGQFDSRWVEIEGIVTALEKQRLTLSISGGQIIVWINQLDTNAFKSLSGSLVRVRGVCSPVVNGRNQRLGVRILLPSSEFVENLNPIRENPFNAPSVPIAAVMGAGRQIGGMPAQLVKTVGVVTCRQPHLLFIQAGTDGVRVSLGEDTDVTPGDEVEAVGWPQPDGFSAKLGQAVVRRIGQGALPKALAIDLLTNNAGDMEQQRDATRIEIEAVLLGQSVDQSVCVLNLQDERAQQVFCAYLPLTNAEQRLPIPVGSRLRLQGVFKTIRDKAPDVDQAATSFEMYLNSPDDIVVTARPNWWSPQHILWLIGAFASVLTIVLAWVGLLRNQVRQRTHDLRLKIQEHQRSEAMLAAEIIERKRVQAEADKAHGQLLVVAREAGMAEVAIGVLHNVGNVLNSVNVSSSILMDRLQQLNSERLSKAVALMREHEEDLAAFLSSDPKGKQMMAYLETLAAHLTTEQTGALTELESLAKNIEHIKEIVAVQQSYATQVGMTEPVQVIDLVEDALRMNARGLDRHEVQTIRQYEKHLPVIHADKHKILQILVNLIFNAKQACDESGRPDKQLIIRVFNGDGTVKISTCDNGIGIPPENMSRIFNHGFTTRKNGHGFGLHNAALAAKEMGGALRVTSPGPGKGANFTLELPAPKQDN
jgi:signal transduction histidine kinase